MTVITLILGIGTALVLGLVGQYAIGSAVWAVILGLVGFFGVTVPLNLWTKRRLEQIFRNVQTHIEGSHAAIRRKVNQMQNRMSGAGKGLQRQIEKQQADSIREALGLLDEAQGLHRWSVLAERQENTLRAQLHFQLREYEKADKYFDKCLVLDPLTAAMRMARMYSNEEFEDLEKAYKKAIKRYKDEKGTLIYALYSWILVKQDRIDEAVAVLVKGKEETESEVLRHNWEFLVNGKTRRFSNAALGDEWYALQLETPKPVRVRQRSLRGRMR